MGFATLVSRVLGMVREMVYAGYMGDSPVAGIFKLAYTIPNLFRRLLGEGALTAAFIPTFKDKERNEGEASMWESANAVLSATLVATGVIVLLAWAGLSAALASQAWSGETRLVLELTRLMFPYLMLVCVAAILIGMLNSRGHFFVPAMGAAMLNVVMILAVFLIAPRFGASLEQQVYGLGVGILLAGVAQVIYQVPTLWKQGFRFRWITPWKHPTVVEVTRKMIPGTLGVAAFQINVLFTQLLAFHVDPVINAAFDYAVRLMEFPQGIFGLSLATYLLPTLSGMAAEKKYPEFRSTLVRGLEHLLFVNLFASGLLLALAEPMVRLILERGAFTATSTDRVSFALTCLAPGLVFFSMVHVLARAFYALGDTRTPMRIGAFCLAMNLLFAWWLIPAFRQGGMGIANTLSSLMNVGLLLFALRKKLPAIDFSGMKRSGQGMLACAALACLVALGVRMMWTQWLGHATLPARLGEVFGPILISGLVYAAVSWWSGISSAKEILRLAGSKFRSWTGFQGTG